MVYLAAAGLPFAVPEPVAARSGALLSEAEGHVVAGKRGHESRQRPYVSGDRGRGP
jgi:hypothetical protein